MRLFGWFRKKPRELSTEHKEALHAEARAIEDVHRTRLGLPENLVMRANIAHETERNHFGDRLSLALQRKHRYDAQ